MRSIRDRNIAVAAAWQFGLHAEQPELDPEHRQERETAAERERTP
jgi:hypothetical protein